MFRFRKKYLLLAVILFVIEVVIALYVRDGFIRPYFGDYLVVMLVYCFVMSFFDLPVKWACIGVLLFAYAVEVMQYLNVVELLGLGNNNTARTVIGVSFEWLDMLAYTLGVATIYLLEKNRKG